MREALRLLSAEGLVEATALADAGLDVEFEFSKPRNLLPWRLPRAMSNTL